MTKASDLLGAEAFDSGGASLGTIDDLICRPGSDGVPRIVEVLVSARRRHRLLGYERDGIQGPWVLEQLARFLHRGARTVAWASIDHVTPRARR
jgi:hypothetical protein